MIYFLSLMYTYFTVLRCIIFVKILINGLFSYWIFLAKKMTILYSYIRYIISFLIKYLFLLRKNRYCFLFPAHPIHSKFLSLIKQYLYGLYPKILNSLLF